MVGNLQRASYIKRGNGIAELKVVILLRDAHPLLDMGVGNLLCAFG